MSKRKKTMLDVLFVLMTVAFFAISWTFVKGCEKL
jgi:preprotein translocase subunit SecE